MEPAATAAYIEEITEELTELAKASRLSLLAYLLSLARLEAGMSRAAGKPMTKVASRSH